MAREFKVSREQELPATAEQVWAAVATGPGNQGWLYPMDVEPGVGGKVSRGPATVTEWEPPHRFVCRFQNDVGFSNTLSYTVDGRADGTAGLRMGIHWVQEGEADAGWDTRADAAEKHVDFYQHSLEQYLRYFAGRPAVYVRAARSEAPADAGAFAALRGRLGLPEDAAAGDTVRLAPEGVDPLDAVVDYLTPDFIGLRTADGLYRFYNGSAWNWPIWLGHHLFAADADEEAAGKAWNAWLDGATT